MNALVILPILIPVAAAACCILVRRSLEAQRTISLAGSLLHFAASAALLARVRTEGIVAIQLGGWQAPFGISLVADLLAAFMAAIAGLMGACVNVYAVGALGRKREAAGFHPLYQVLIAGASGAFLAGDIFNLYVLFEVMLIASFGLAAARGGRRQSGGAVNYVTFNLLASFLFLLSVGLLYRNSGTLNMAALSLALGGEDPGHVHVLAVLFMVAFGVKAAAFPFFLWLPDSYPGFPVAVIAIFAALLTKVGVYALIRVFTLLFFRDPEFTHELILVSAGFTMVMGGLGAAYHKELRTILSFHIVSQIGYSLLGLGLFSLTGLGGAIFFLFHNILAKTNLFLVAGLVKRTQGSYALAGLGGILDRSPAMACLFLVPALSLAGIPPLSGAVAKFMLIRAGLDSGRYLVTAAALGAALITLYSMTKIWNLAFLRPAGEGEESEEAAAQPPMSRGQAALLWGPCLVLAALTVAGGIGAQPLVALAGDAARQLLDREGYVRAVLGAP